MKNLSKREIEKLWENFGKVPVNDDGEIEEYFIGFPKGTHREEVWYWFDEIHPDGVYQLMQ